VERRVKPNPSKVKQRDYMVKMFGIDGRVEDCSINMVNELESITNVSVRSKVSTNTRDEKTTATIEITNSRSISVLSLLVPDMDRTLTRNRTRSSFPIRVLSLREEAIVKCPLDIFLDVEEIGLGFFYKLFLVHLSFPPLSQTKKARDTSICSLIILFFLAKRS